MNAVEIEEAVSALAGQPFDPAEFPFAFLEAFGNKATTIKRLRSGASNKSDVGGVLQTGNIHIAVAAPGDVTRTLAALKASPATGKAKAKFVLATDGDTFEAEDVESGETVACAFADFPDHFGFFLPLAGISTVRQVRESSFDIRATSRLNRLYVELLKDNPEWGTAERRPDMNHFMARLIFCFYAEDTFIFHPSHPFTDTIEKMSERDASNIHEVIGELFRAMNTRKEDHEAAGIRNWARPFPYVNGGLFSGSFEVPRFSRIARSYLLHIGNLNWKQINPDIFGSMIQAVADDEERGALGMHYTSRPNILKVLNPLFLDSLREQLEEADDNARKLLNLRNRMARIRVFDPACGSGNFLVIAYKEMREIEAEINRRRGEDGRASDIPLTNFRGIELRDFPAEIARLALIIAEFQCDALGMRPMQERAYEKRGEQYLLIKSPPASGKSRALMFIALDKLANQGIKQAIIVVPEKSIGSSFNDEPLSQFGFWADWCVQPQWNLCNAPGTENGGKVNSLGAFLESDDKVLVCTHATFRFAVDRFGIEAFDDRLIAVDEFHHVSVGEDNKLGRHLGEFIARDRVHIVAMTGSYFRGDAEAVLSPQDEARFDSVTYTYYEQLNGYEHLKRLDIGYFFYSGAYVDDILAVLDPAEKTIIHIPNVNSRESTKDKIREVEHIIEELGDWQGTDAATGFQLVKTPDGRTLRIADLVDDDPAKRDRVSAALKDPAQKSNRDHVDIIIALGMAKEGFDWIWCEHALTVGYRASLTEIVQIIGRATRDAPGKARARFTNLIAEPDASEGAVTEAVNDTLKAIAASLLMEQVLAPRFEFKPKNPANVATPGFDYGEGGYDADKCNVGFDGDRGVFQIEIKGLAEPKSPEAARICREDLNEVIATFVQDKPSIERGLFDEELVPEELTQLRLGKIIKDKYPELDNEDQEAVRQHAIAALNLTQQAARIAIGDENEPSANTALIDGVRKFAMDVRQLDIDLIDRINPFGEAYAILAKTMSEESLKQVAAAIAAKRTSLSPQEALELADRARRFIRERGRPPSVTSADAWEKRMAEGAAAFMRFRKEGRYD